MPIKKAKKVFIQLQSTDVERERLAAVAEYRGGSMSAVVRAYINKAFMALPDEAKQGIK